MLVQFATIIVSESLFNMKWKMISFFILPLMSDISQLLHRAGNAQFEITPASGVSVDNFVVKMLTNLGEHTKWTETLSSF
jgi:hypothetical protein